MKRSYVSDLCFFTFLSLLVLTACSKDNGGRKVTSYKELNITVASVTLPGVVSSCGNDACSEVYAVKVEDSQEWTALSGIKQFEYQEGYEYQLRISETTFLDFSMGEPVWTEYELLELKSKTKRISQNLPTHFIPDWFFQYHSSFINPDFLYAVDADIKETIERDIQTNAAYRFNGCKFYIPSMHLDDWFLLDNKMQIVQSGNIIKNSKELETFPESYSLLKPEDPVCEYLQYKFVTTNSPDEPELLYDVFISSKNTPYNPAFFQRNSIWMYQDLTSYYQRKYPTANINTVVLRYELKYVI